MDSIEQKIKDMGLYLPPPLKVPPGLVLPFKPIIVHGNHVYISGHAPQDPDGSISKPLGKLGRDLTVEQGYKCAQLVGLSILGDLKRAIGSLDRVKQWLKALGMVNAVPEFTSTTPVINGFSELIVSLFGPDVGAHTRSAVGMSTLPLDIPVEIEGELIISD
ncbi:MAG: RidA family protein [Hyphomicrobiales bacterium]